MVQIGHELAEIEMHLLVNFKAAAAAISNYNESSIFEPE